MEQPFQTEYSVRIRNTSNGLYTDGYIDLKQYAPVINDDVSFSNWLNIRANSYELSISQKDFNVFDFLDELKTEIMEAKNKNKRLLTFSQEKKNFISRWNAIKADYTSYDIEITKPIIDKSLEWIDKTQKESTQFLIVNLETIFAMIDDKILEHKEKLKTLEKTARQKYNANAYAKRKELLNIADKIKLTPEERVEHRKATYKKYYDKTREGIPKRVPLTEEQKRENRKATQKKYNEKVKQQKAEAKTIIDKEII